MSSVKSYENIGRSKREDFEAPEAIVIGRFDFSGEQTPRRKYRKMRNYDRDKKDCCMCCDCLTELFKCC